MHEEEFAKLASLCRISLKEEEKKDFFHSITNILEYIEALMDVDTKGVPPCHTVLETLSNVVQEDLPQPPLSREVFLANTPSHIGGMVRVPPVIKQG